jgi:hypothetical protein
VIRLRPAMHPSSGLALMANVKSVEPSAKRFSVIRQGVRAFRLSSVVSTHRAKSSQRVFIALLKKR